MALLLARLLAGQGLYDPEEAMKAYIPWLKSGPFDFGMTVSSGMRGRPNPDNQAYGTNSPMKILTPKTKPVWISSG